MSTRTTSRGLAIPETPATGASGPHGQRTKVSQPETPRQAQRFTELRNDYARAGLCDQCAAQAAYGHQHGWYAVRQPCAECLPIVATFPSAKGNLWRSIDRKDFHQ